MSQYRIGEITAKLGVSADTLRYYERIGLLPKVSRIAGGVRLYNDKDLSRLHFVRRAQAMNFSLAEIALLLRMRESPATARAPARQLTERKLAEIEARLGELKTLRDELRLLVNLCARSRKSCPIIKRMDRK